MYALICFGRPDSAPLRDKHRAAEAFIGADPFHRGGVYENLSVRAVKQVFPPK